MAATTRYVRADAAGSGDGTTNTNSGGTGAFTIAEAITYSTTHTNMLFEVMAVGGTFAMGATNLTFSGSGTAAALNKWRGNNTTVGDCEADITLTPPRFTFTTGVPTFSGNFQEISCIDFLVTGANGSAALVVSGAPFNLFRVAAEHQSVASAGNRAINAGSGGRLYISECYFKCTSTASTTCSISAEFHMTDSVILGGTGAMSMGTNQSLALTRNIINTTGIGLQQAGTGAVLIDGNTWYGMTSDAIQFQSASNAITGRIENNIFSNITGTCIKGTTGTATGVMRNRNAFWTVGARESGLGDPPARNEITLAASPFVTAGTDYRVLSTSLAYNVLRRFKSVTAFSSYGDIGAVGNTRYAVGMM